jgi:HAD superfamily hydrolase (TIGR01490 family)
VALALFDIDRTLIAINSANSWVRHEWRGGRLSTWDAVRGAYWVGRYHLGLDAGMEEVYRDAVRLIAGQEEEAVAARTRAWFAAEIAPTVRPGALEALARHRAAGDRLVIATSSSPYAAAAAAATWGLDDVVSSAFAVVDGRFTGEVAALAYGPHKLTRAAEWAARAGHDLAAATFYTDSITDLALMEAVAHPVAVNPDRVLARVAAARGWPVVDWGRP